MCETINESCVSHRYDHRKNFKSVLNLCEITNKYENDVNNRIQRIQNFVNCLGKHIQSNPVTNNLNGVDTAVVYSSPVKSLGPNEINQRLFERDISRNACYTLKSTPKAVLNSPRLRKSSRLSRILDQPQPALSKTTNHQNNEQEPSAHSFDVFDMPLKSASLNKRKRVKKIAPRSNTSGPDFVSYLPEKTSINSGSKPQPNFEEFSQDSDKKIPKPADLTIKSLLKTRASSKTEFKNSPKSKSITFEDCSVHTIKPSYVSQQNKRETSTLLKNGRKSVMKIQQQSGPAYASYCIGQDIDVAHEQTGLTHLSYTLQDTPKSLVVKKLKNSPEKVESKQAASPTKPPNEPRYIAPEPIPIVIFTQEEKIEEEQKNIEFSEIGEVSRTGIKGKRKPKKFWNKIIPLSSKGRQQIIRSFRGHKTVITPKKTKKVFLKQQKTVKNKSKRSLFSRVCDVSSESTLSVSKTKKQSLITKAKYKPPNPK
ncbi:hypothetical protein HZS_7964, partial [Henneguya salminicola]